jgi:hypothetical protein
MSDEPTKVLYRWDNHDEDREVYDQIFDEAIKMIAEDEKALGSLLMQVINQWEMNRRNIPMPVISAAYDLVLERQRVRELDHDITQILSGTPEAQTS